MAVAGIEDNTQPSSVIPLHIDRQNEMQQVNIFVQTV